MKKLLETPAIKFLLTPREPHPSDDL